MQEDIMFVDGSGLVDRKYDVDITVLYKNEFIWHGKCHVDNNIITRYDIVIQCEHLIIN